MRSRFVPPTVRHAGTAIRLVIALILLPALTEGAPRRPNILFAFADDWGRHASAYGKIENESSANRVVQTPNFDRVAREGILFKNAFVTAPSCTPCRSSLLSGQYFWRTGRAAILQGAQWDDSIPSFPLLLREAGYHIGQTYKVWSPGTPVDAPYGGKRFEYEKAGSRFNQFSQNATAMVADGLTIPAAKQALYAEVTGNFDAFLRDRKGDEPFCYWFGPTLVHRKWTKGSGKALWGIDPDRLKGKLPKFLPDVPEVREDLADYFGEVQAFDAALGLLLERLEQLGELDNTLIVVSGDHGAPGFPNGKCNLYDFGVGVPLAIRWGAAPGGRIVDDFVNLMDLAPTFLEAGGVPPSSEMTGRSVVNVLRSSQSGLVDPTRTWVITGRERHVAAARDESMPYPHRALRTKDYLYIINFKPDRWPMGNPYNLTENQAPGQEALTENTMISFMDFDASPTKAWLVAHRSDPEWAAYYQRAFGKRPREELYVLSDDPDQVSNVANDTRYQSIREQLNHELLNELRRTQDPRVTGDGSTFDKPPFANPTNVDRN
jgi:N-sulfoglucosamine sulfohydrolase